MLDHYELSGELQAVLQTNLQYVQEHLMVETSGDKCHTKIALPRDDSEDVKMDEKEVDTMFERHGVADPPHTPSKSQPEAKQADSEQDTYQVRLVERDVTKWVRPQRRLDRVVVDKQIDTVIVKSTPRRK